MKRARESGGIGWDSVDVGTTKMMDDASGLKAVVVGARSYSKSKRFCVCEEKTQIMLNLRDWGGDDCD